MEFHKDSVLYARDIMIIEDADFEKSSNNMLNLTVVSMLAISSIYFYRRRKAN